MSLTREEYVKICQTCTKRVSSMQKGIICSLTGEHAAFEPPKCPDYKVDQKAIEKQQVQQQRAAEDKQDQMGIFSGNGGVIGGVILIALGIIWIILGIALADRFFFYPIALIIGGIMSVNKGLKQKAAQKKIENSNVIDDDFEEIF